MLESDSLALVALYDSTDGANWTNPWDLSTPVDTWLGVTVSGGRVTVLDLNTNNLSGSIPTELGNLANLTYLSLNNNQLSGSIPAELGNLANLTTLYLHSNQLTGSIPAEMGSLANLTTLWLSSNQLSGPVPAELGNLANLTILLLYSNQLSGSIPAELGNLANLIELRLSSNQLSGSIPPGLGNLANLTTFYLYSNQLSDSIPPRLGNLANLIELRLSSNQLSGSIPPELGNLANLTILLLYSNQLSGSIPAELGNLADLKYLYLNSNQLTGNIPSELGNLANLIELRLSSNQLSGSIPPGLGNLANLTTFYLYSNQLSDSIPPELGNLANLTHLELNSNQLSGSIPAELGNLADLKYLYLNSNQLTGNISSELGNLANLIELRLSSNQLSGSIPAELGNLANLTILYLYSNQLTGSISAELGNLANLIELRLSSNQLSGLPDLSTLTALDYLLVENNRLTFEDLEPNMGVASASFTYVPQDSVGSVIDATAYVGSSRTLSISVGGTANVYQWIKDGVDIPGATDAALSISSVAYADSGSYGLRITNTIVPGLTLRSRPIRLKVVEYQEPVLTAVPDTTIQEDDTLRIVLHGSSIFGDPLTYGATSDTGAVASTVEGSLLTIIPEPQWNGVASIFVSVSDGQATVRDTFAVTVAPVNDPPVVANAVGITVSEGDTVAVTSADLQVTDVDNSNAELSYTFEAQLTDLTGEFILSGVALADTARFTQADINSGRISFAHDGSETTLDSIGFSISDSDGATAHIAYFPITIIPVNDPPEPFALLEPADGDTIEIVDDSLLFVWGSSEDIEGDTLVYNFNIYGPGYDTTIAGLIDTTLVLTEMAVLALDSLYTWYVDVLDGTDTTSCLADYQFRMPSVLALDPVANIPEEFALHQNYPNPFNPSTTIRFELPLATDVHLAVYDLLGREVVRLVDGHLEAGYHRQVWNGRDRNGREAPTGIYFVLVVTPEFRKSIKTVLLK